uniref:Carboxypeptidase regulatory-like domain-containing protein n=1 Tax=Thermofilum pendens TaxID=2269 RepID=A0A7C4FEA0_THEPE
MKVKLVLGFLLACLALTAVLAVPSLQVPAFYARADLLVTVEETYELDFSSKSVITLMSASPLPGFTLDRFVVIFEGGAPQGVQPLKYDKKSERMGVLESVLSYNGEVSLGSNGYNGTCKVRTLTVMRRTTWYPLSGSIEVDTSEFTGTGFKDVTLKITLDNYAPYAVKQVLGPEGENLLDIKSQEALGAGVVKVDPKHVEIKTSRIGFGKYTVKVERNDAYILPSAMLVIEEDFIEQTLPAKGSKTLALRAKAGWKPLGWIIVAYSVAPGPLDNNYVQVEGDLANFVAEKKDEFEVRGASLLIPPLLLHYWIRAYLVYGNTVKVTNLGKHDVQLLAIPVYFREAGTWTSKGVEITVSQKDLGAAYAAFLVVQVPVLARIKSVTLPSGITVTGFENYTASWDGEWRTIIVEDHEVAVQVKNGAKVDEGVYTIAVEWSPLRIKPVDAKSRAVAGAEVTVEGPLKISGVTGVDGVATVKIYAPGVYRVAVKYKGSTAGEIVLGTLMEQEITIPCALYDLQVNVKTALGSPVTGAQVTVSGQSGYTQSLETDDNGRVFFTQLPEGTYVVKAEYKGVSAQQTVSLSTDTVLDVNMGILFELPLLGPVTATTAAAVGVASALVAGAAFSRSKRKEEAEIELE